MVWSHGFVCSGVALAHAAAIVIALELGPNVAFCFGSISFTPIHGCTCTCKNGTTGN